MKKTKYITLCGLMAALASAFMLTSYFPYLTIAIPAMAGLFIMVSVIELGVKWAIPTYLSSAVIVFLIAEPEAKLLYILFFGYYPILKAVTERQKNRALEYAIKFVVFNLAIFLIYGVFASIFGISLEDFGDFGKYTIAIVFVVENIVFVLYDKAVSQLAGFYMYRLHSIVKRILK